MCGIRLKLVFRAFSQRIKLIRIFIFLLQKYASLSSNFYTSIRMSSKIKKTV